MSGILVALTPDIFAPWSDWDITHEFEPIEGVQVYRDGNGALQVADPVGGLESRRKYRLTLSAEDVEAFAFGGIWPGQEFTVDCAQLTTHVLPSGTNTVTLERTAVPGSIVARTKDGADLTVSSYVDNVVTVASHTGQAAYVAYRQRLTMRLVGPWKQTYRRNESSSTSSIVLEEE